MQPLEKDKHEIAFSSELHQFYKQLSKAQCTKASQ